MESNYVKSFSKQAVPSMELKFSMYVVVQRPTYCAYFGEFRINSFLQQNKNEFLYITACGVKL